jgi:hypothetical protein
MFRERRKIMNPNNYYRNAPRNIPPNQYYAAPPQNSTYYPYYVAPQPQSPPNYPYYVPYRNLPPVDTKMFIKSAKCIQNLMNSANIIVDKFASSQKFSVNIMTAAQFSNQKEVEKLIHSLGLKDEPTVKYTPDGITISFDTKENNFDVCHLSLKIRWG